MISLLKEHSQNYLKILIYSIITQFSYFCSDMQKLIATYENSQEFIGRLKQGDKQAFNELFKGSFSKLYHFANAIVTNPSLAQDIVQELFVTLWTKREHLDESQSLTNYLYVSVRNSCYTYLSKQKRYTSLEELLNHPLPADNPPESEDPRNQILWDAIENLPLQQKIIFKLIVVEEYSYKEVGSKLDISVNTIKTQIQRACKRLKETLPPSHFFLLILLNRLQEKCSE